MPTQRLTPRALQLAGQSMVLRDLTAADMPEVLRLHRDVFGSSVAADWYEWKYSLGGGEAVGVWHGDRLIAHCAGMPRTFWHQGRTQRDLQIGDVMVAPQWRGILTRQGPFFHASHGLYASRLGSSRPYAVGFGFPNARHLRLAVKSSLSWDAGVLHELRWETPAQKTAAGRLWRAEEVSPMSSGFDQNLASIGQRMLDEARSWSIGDRSAQYVRWRFVQRPGPAPVFLQIRRPWRSTPVGIAVLAPIAEGQPVHWLDWIGPVSLLREACRLCTAFARTNGASGLVSWVSQGVRELLADSGYCASSPVCGIGVPVASDIKPAELDNLNWWFMSGDTDFL